MNQFLEFYKCIINKKLFYLPIFFFAIVGYSFSIYNRTISLDDLARDYYIGGGNPFYNGRWGMDVWNNLIGVSVVLDPFLDRFAALFLLIVASFLLCYLLYSIGRTQNVIAYTITASVFITYPLINEIWEYTGANFMVCGNLCLVTIGAICLREYVLQNPTPKKLLLSSLFFILPASSYETAIFFYISLVNIVILLEAIESNDNSLNYKDWAWKILLYFFPVVVALIVRIFVSQLIMVLFEMPYNAGGASTGVLWFSDNVLHVLKCMFAFNVVHYVLFALIYFPITIFLFALFFFILYIFLCKNQTKVIILSIFVIFSLFSQSILQGFELSYRHAQTISLFVAFTAFLYSNLPVRRFWKYSIYLLVFLLCWRQSIYLNRIFGLNNLRSDNEVAILGEIGYRLTSEYEKKPVVFVGSFQYEKPIRDQITVNENSWNGKLFYYLYEKSLCKLDRPYKYVGTNLQAATWEYYQISDFLNYCGYNIDVIPNYLYGNNIEKEQLILNDATQITQENNLRPYQIFDNGNYLIVNLGSNSRK